MSIIKQIKILLCYARNHINLETKEVKYSTLSFPKSGKQIFKTNVSFFIGRVFVRTQEVSRKWSQEKNGS